VPVAAVPLDFQLHNHSCYKLDHILNQCMTRVAWLVVQLGLLLLHRSTMNKNLVEMIYNGCHLQMCIDLLGTFTVVLLRYPFSSSSNARSMLWHWVKSSFPEVDRIFGFCFLVGSEFHITMFTVPKLHA